MSLYWYLIEMFCPHCSKLAILNNKRVCVRCQGEIKNNLSCICDRCSNEQGVCSICLKKTNMDAGNKSIRVRRGCGCGKK